MCDKSCLTTAFWGTTEQFKAEFNGLVFWCNHTWKVLLKCQVMPQLTPLPAGPSLYGICGGLSALVQVFLPVLRFSPDSIISPVLHNHSFTHLSPTLYDLSHQQRHK